MPQLRVPHSSSAPALTISMAGRLFVSTPRSPSLLPSGLPRRDQHHQGRIATGPYYALVHICRQPARLGEIMMSGPTKAPWSAV